MDSKRIDIGVGIVLCVLSAAVFLYAEQYVGRGVNRYGPNFFPQVLAAALFVCALFLIIQAVRGNALKDLEPIHKAGFINVSVTFGISLIYLVVMQYLGFFMSTILFLFIVMTYLKQKNIWVRSTVSILVTIVIYAIFMYFLKIPLPEGVFYSS